MKLGVKIQSETDPILWYEKDDFPYTDKKELDLSDILTEVTGDIKDGIGYITDDPDFRSFNKEDGYEIWLRKLVTSDDPSYKERIRLSGSFDKDLPLSGIPEVNLSCAFMEERGIISVILADIYGDEFTVLTRAHLDPGNRNGLFEKEPVIPNEFIRYSLKVEPIDHLLVSGHKLALLIFGTDVEQTIRPHTSHKIMIDLSNIVLSI